ncbi:hypothetical protein SAMN04488540_104144 [Ferrimonas sediminum]|uniref:CS1 type fimbrial major subunit n=1 Tax=Ferrimonas sediminum TaxID=718193 RepID=A0A1G8PZZ5_9GAMM|nr:hypothetical protein [Ferrimonas sediminum]SDI98017.1 hypothetical protein SAMN04488540_104144 [Ferrimonas sediminum]
MKPLFALMLAALASQASAATVDVSIELSLPGSDPMTLQVSPEANEWAHYPLGDYQLSIRPSTSSDQKDDIITVDAILTQGAGNNTNQLLMPAITVLSGDKGAIELGKPPRSVNFAVSATLAD